MSPIDRHTHTIKVSLKLCTSSQRENTSNGVSKDICCIKQLPHSHVTAFLSERHDFLLVDTFHYVVTQACCILTWKHGKNFRQCHIFMDFYCTLWQVFVIEIFLFVNNTFYDYFCPYFNVLWVISKSSNTQTVWGTVYISQGKYRWMVLWWICVFGYFSNHI